MRTLFIVNSLVNTYPTAKGALAVKLPNAFVADAAGLLNVPAFKKSNYASLDLINSLGNGSVKTFTINPFDVYQVSEESGKRDGQAISNVAPKYTITYPTGNARTDSFGNQFVGGIVVKELDKDKNVYNTKKIIPIEVVGSAGVVSNADVVTAFKAAMATITGTGNYISTATPNASPAVFNLTDDKTYIELTGDLRYFPLIRTNGMKYTISGVEVAKLEKELASNSGYQKATELDNELFELDNFIADTSAEYNFVTVVTTAQAQRPLLPNAAGFPKTLHIAFLKDGGTVDTIFANFKTFINTLLIDPTGGINNTIDADIAAIP